MLSVIIYIYLKYYKENLFVYVKIYKDKFK